jgi:hypothetical protein
VEYFLRGLEIRCITPLQMTVNVMNDYFIWHRD